MKTLGLIAAATLLLLGTVASRGADVTRISTETGVPVATLQAEKASTGLGWGGLEKAHLLASASGQSFDSVVGKFHGGEGWGKIAHDYNLNLGKVVSGARHSSHATAHANNNNHMGHGKGTANMGRGHTNKMSNRQGFGHRSGSAGEYHGMHSMGHMGHSIGGMGHGAHR
jgi:hypothetical protein